MITELAKRNLTAKRLIPLNSLSLSPFIANVDLNANHFRVPAGAKLNNGDMLAFCQVQYDGADDYAHQDIGISKSTDGGKTWGNKRILSYATNTSRVLNPTVIYDAELNKIILFVTELFSLDRSIYWWKLPDSLWKTYTYTSTDNGTTWEKRDITSSIKSETGEHQRVVMGGLGTGVKMEDGTYVVGVEVGYYDGSYDQIQMCLMYSKDLVQWSVSNPIDTTGDEFNIVLLDSRTILVNARNFRTVSPKARKIYYTQDLGTTWHEHTTHQTIPENRATMGHTLKINYEGNDYIIFSHMQSENNTRKELGISVLNSTQSNWNPVEVIQPAEYGGYSFLLWNKETPSKLHVLYSMGGNVLCDDISYLLPKIKENYTL